MIRLQLQPIFQVLIALVYLPSYATAVGPPTVLTFDDIVTDAGNPILMPAGYGGVNWPSHVGVYGLDEGPNYIPQSSPNRMILNYFPPFDLPETVVTFIGGPKIFNGAYFSGLLHDVHFNLYSGPLLVGTSSTLSFGMFGGEPTYLASGYPGPVDSVGIVGEPGWFAMDSFTFENVPEPSTLFLLAVAPISLLGYRKAKTRG